MTGMKEGAGEDPFADDQTESTTAVDSDDPDDITNTAMAETLTTTTTEIPLIFRRDSVQDDRDRVPLFLQEETKRSERDARRELEERFNDDVSLTDLREALLLAGLDNLDTVENHLEDWGYGLTFD